jgi:hypothetical protein
MNIQDLNIIIGEYLDLKEIKILSKILQTDEWNVYDMVVDIKNNFKYFSTKQQYSIDTYALTTTCKVIEISKNVKILKLHVNIGDKIPIIPEGLHTLVLKNSLISGVIYDDFFPRYLHTLDISFTNITNINNFPKGLKVLKLHGSSIEDEIIKNLPKGLYELNLSYTKVTDGIVKYIPRSVSILDIGNTQITCKSFKDLPKGLRNLIYDTIVFNSNNELKDFPKGLHTLTLYDYFNCANVELINLPWNLHTLILHGFLTSTKYNSNINYKKINNIPKGLHTLEINYIYIHKSCIRYFPKGLHTLSLINTNLNNDDIKYLPRSLHTLTIENSAINDDCIEDLPRSLCKISLEGTKISDDGLCYVDDIISKNIG